MLKRSITAVAATIVLLPILWFSDTLVFPIALALAALLCLFEMFRCMGLHKNLAITLPLYAAALAFPVLQREIDYVSLVMVAFICAALYAVYLFALIIWSQGKIAYKDATACAFTALYIIVAMNMIVYIRDFGDRGKYLYFLIFIGAWVTDIFAYFSGFFFGRHKLIESVSPKKTIEGSIGGTLFCAIGFVVMGAIANSFGCDANFVFLAIGGIIVSIISQIGDLIMSVIKRHYGIKDYGRLFPGHGGMLDRLDSILAVSIALAALCMFSQLVGIPLM